MGPKKKKSLMVEITLGLDHTNKDGGRARSAPLVLQHVKRLLVLGFENHDEVVWSDKATAILVRLAHEDVVQA